ncbi:MAG: GatB/YqeY domain-containing protein, partial [Actinomycetota bacterium]
MRQNGRVASLKDRLKADLTASMKARQETTTSTLRMVLSAVMNAEVAGDSVKVLSDDQILDILQAEVKKRNESAEIYAGAGRAEAAQQERAEAAIIEAYLPAAMSDEELGKIVAEEVATATAGGVTGGKAMGAVVKAVRARAGASADGAKIAALVKSALG